MDCSGVRCHYSACSSCGYNQDLFEATRKGETAKVKYLLQAGADGNALEGETRGEGTVLSLAAALGHTEVVRLLLAAGAEVKTRERQPRKGIDAAKLLKTVEENGYTEIAEMLKKALERELISELADACYMGDFEVVRILVKMGADINAEDSDGVTAIEYAAAAGNKGIYEFLIANGANFDLFLCSAAGDKVIILGKSEKEEKILNMVAPWYKIKTEDGTVGYSYGYFFDVNVLELKAAPTF